MLEQLLPHLHPFPVLLLIASFLTIRALVKQHLARRRIRSLGGYAPRVRNYLPLSLDLVYSGIWHASRNRNLEFWTQRLLRYANPENPYTVDASIGGERIIFTADPENIKAILATQFADYGKGKEFNEVWHDFLGDSIFTTDGATWHDSRQLIRPQFVRDRLSDLEIFERHIEVLLAALQGDGQGATVDVADLFFRYTLDAATDFLLGRSVDSLVNPQAKFADAFGEVQRVQSVIARTGPLHWMVPRGSFRRGLKVINQFVNPFIEQALRLSPEELEKRVKGEEGYTFLHALAAYTRDRTVLRDQLVAVLLAGRDTTAATLSWLFYELSRRPGVVRRLRREVLDVVGRERKPSYGDLKVMRYLQHTLNETLRLYPVVPFNVRVALRDTTLPHGAGPDGNQPVGILEGTPIGYSTLVMQRREDLYPPPSSGFPPVLDFVPERWEGWTPKSWTYIPFNGGPRICVGQQFALTEMAYTVVRILQRFGRVEDRMGGVKPGLKADIVLQPSEEVRVAFFEDEGVEG